MEVPSSQATTQLSFKQVLVQDSRNSRSSTQDNCTGGALDLEVNPSNLHFNPKVSYAFTKDNVPIVDTYLLSVVSSFEQLYLIGMVLGESLPLKFIPSKCLSEWKLVWQG